MIRFLRLGILVFFLFATTASAQQLYINELSQGSSGNKEFVEFVVSGSHTCIDSTLDIRNIIFDDNPGWYTTTSVGTGCYRFANISNWSAVKYGSIIIVYNSADKNLTLPADDSTDANGDGVYVLPSTCSFLQVNATSPTSSTSYNYATAVAGTWTAPVLASWGNALALGNGGDAFHIINPAVSTTVAIHSISYGSNTGGAQTANIYIANLGAATVAYNNGSSPTTQSSWSTGTATTSAATSAETPGAANNTANATWITSLKALNAVRYYVDGSVATSGTGSSWASPYKRLTDALRAANAGICETEIWVKAGTYYPTASTNRDSSFRIVRNGIKVYGGFSGNETSLSQRSVLANPTVLSGDIGVVNDSTDNVYHVFQIAGPASTPIDTSTVLSGFTITRGEANGSGLVSFGTSYANRTDGGGLNCTGNVVGSCSPWIDSCTFTQNYAGFGGGLYGYANSGGKCSPLITACTFSNNRVQNNGGGYATFGDGTNPVASPQLKNCTFSNNIAGLAGSGIHIYLSVATAKSFAKIDSCTFTGNNGGTATGLYGTVYIRGGGGVTDSVRPVFTGCTATGNTVGRGGFAHVEYGTLGTFAGCTITNNTAFSYGGGITSQDASTAISNCTFTGNSAVNGTSGGTQGGAIFIYSSTLRRTHTISNCSFSYNLAYGNGGAIAVQDSSIVSLSNITSVGNHAVTGSGGFMQTQVQNPLTLTVTNSSFTSDSAMYGAIFHNGNPGVSTYTACKFLNAYGGGTGAFDNYGGGANTFYNCVFSGNKAAQNGAALHAYNTKDTLTNCVFTDNSTTTTGGNGGGAINVYANASVVTARNCTFYNNTTAQTTYNANTVIIQGGCTLNLQNSIVWGAAQTHIANFGTFNAANSLVKNYALSSPNLTVDPNFVNASNPIGADGIWGTADDGLHLTQCSPAINAGSSSLVPSGTTTDFAAATRIQSTSVDMGAYESAYTATGFDPFVTLSTAPTPNQCGSSTIALYANLQSPGGTPTYQWYRNGTATGSNSPAYSGIFSSTDSVTIRVTNSWCPSYDIAAAQRVLISSAPAVSISGPGNPSCAGATLTANSSINPLAIQWNLNGAPLVMQNCSYGAGTTVAGTGTAGAALTQINAPWGMFVDRYRNVYVAEQGGNRITMWAPPYTTGSLVAGTGTAGNAPNQLYSPGDVYVDDYGYAYIADRGNYRVQRWAPGANTAVTVAGGNGAGAALNQFNYPASLAVDDSANIYVTDFLNARVMKWAPGATAGSVVAGTGTAGAGLSQLNAPSYLFIDKATRNLYITDEGNHRIMMWAPNATAGVVVAGGNGAGSNGNQLNAPRGVARDAAGNLYVNDGGNNRIVVWQSGAKAGTVIAAGNGSGSAANQLNFPLDMQVDSSGNIYVADGNNNRVQRFSPSIINTITAVAPGNYTATITPANGCPATTASYTINPLPLSTVDTSSPVICAGDSVSITAASSAAKGNALNFDGTNLNYASIPAGPSNSLSGMSNFTVSAWVYPRSTAHQNILYKGLGCSSWHQWTMGIGGFEAGNEWNPQKWFFSFLTGNGSGISYVYSSDTVQLNTWTYVTVSYDGSRLRLYLNGALNNEAAGSGVPWASTENLYLGQDPGCGGRIPLNGRLDEVSIFSTTKTQADIGGMMNGVIPTTANGLLGYWRFDENNGKKIYDAGPNAQYGTLTGSAYTRQIPSTAPINNAASGPVTYAWSPATGLNATSGATVKASPAATTQYTLTTTHAASGCTNVARVTVDVNALPTANVTPNGTLTSCTGAPVVLVADSALGYSWQWYKGAAAIGGATSRSYTPTATGTYTVKVSNAAGCFVVSAVVNVTVVTTVTPTISISANPAGPICAGTNVLFTATTANGGTTAAIQWLRNGVNVGTAAPTYADATLTTGTTIQARFISNATCRTADTAFSNIITMTVNPQPAISSVSFTNPTTCGGSDGSITINGLTPNTSYTVSYFNGTTTTTLNGQMSNAGGSILLSNLPSGTYSSITVALGTCSATYGSFLTLTPPSAPAGPTAGNSGPICAGATLSLTAHTVAGGTYNWAGPNGFTSTAQNPSILNAQTAASGSYSVTVTVAGCASTPGTTTAIVNPTPAIAAVAGTGPTTCGGTNGSIALSGLTSLATYTINFSWNGTSQPPLTLTADPAGVVTITGLATGTYTAFTATLGACPSASMGSVTLSNPAPPAMPLISTNAPICEGSALNLTGPGTAGITYSWTGPNGFSSALQSPSIAAATTAATGTYSLTVTSTATGCTSAPATVIAAVNSIPVIASSSSVNPATCGGTSGSITLSGLNASSSYAVNYLKNGTPQTQTIISSAAGDVVISGLSAGSYTSVTVSLNNCPSIAAGPFTLSDPALPPAPTASSNSPVCQGSTLNLAATGVAGASFSWTGPSSFSSNAQNPSRSSMSAGFAGTYSVTQTLAGCVSPAATTIVVMSTVPATPGAISGNAAPCVGQTYSYSISSVATATAYTWSTPTGSGWSTTGSIGTSLSLTTGTVSGTLSIVANNGCGSSTPATLALSVNTIPAQPGSISGPAAICNGASASYSVFPVTNTSSYTWTLPSGWAGGGTGAVISATASATSGAVSVIANNVCGSSPAQTLAVTVTSIPAQPGAITGSITPCVASTQTYSIATVSGATSYAWTYPSAGSPAWAGGSLTNSINLTAGATSGNVSVAAVNQCGSSTPRALAVTVTQIPAQPSALSGKTAPCVGAVETYKAALVTGATYYVWTFPSPWIGASTIDSINLLVGTGTATISVSAANACGVSPARSLTATSIPVQTPSAKLARSTPSDTICASTVVTFTATPTNGGAAPVYVFRKNGIVAGSVGNIYTDGGLANGDKITVTMASSLPCVTASQVSDSIKMTVNPLIMPGININTVPPITLCSGATLTFTTNITGGGTTPAYQWYKNGSPLSATTPTYTSSALSNGDTFQVRLTTSALCPAVTSVFSNKVGLTVNPVVNPSITISANPSGPVPVGTTVTFTSVQSGGGQTPGYQWMKNGVSISGETNSTYITNNLATGDRISLRMQSYDLCAQPAVVTSNEIVMQIGATSIARTGGWEGNISLYPNPNSGHFTIAVAMPATHIGQRTYVDVLNPVGQTVYHTELKPDREKWSHDVWLNEGIANGAYMLRLSTEDGMRAVLPFVLGR